MKKLLFFLNFFFMGISYMTSQITFQAVPQQKEAGVNEIVSVQFVLSVKNKSVQNISDIQFPAFSNAQIVSRQYAQNREYSNGDAIMEIVYQLGLKPVQGGIIKADAAKITVDGKLYQTQPFIVKINKPTDSSDGALGMETRSGDDVFLVLKLSNTNPYQNEEVIGQLKLYTRRVDYLNSSGKIISPDFKGLVALPVNQDINNVYQQEVVNGYMYYSKVIAQYVLFPTQARSLKIDPFTLTLSVSNGFFDEGEINIKSEPVMITAKKLPENSPKDFYGVVGDYSLRVVSNQTKVSRGEPVTVTVEVSGKGNFDLVKTPALVIPQGIEQYPPKNKSKSTPTSEGVTGNITSSNVLVPQTSGDFEITVKPFVFFNPQSGNYKTLTAKTISLQVERDSGEIRNDAPMQEQSYSDKTSFISNPKKIVEDVLESTEKQHGLLLVVLLPLLALSLLLIVLGLRRKKKRVKQQDDNFIEEETITDKEKSKEAKLWAAETTQTVDFSSDLQHLNRFAYEGKKFEFYNLLNTLLIKSASQNLQVPENTVSWEEIEEKLQNKYGQVLSENWKELLLKSQIEKYSPVTEDESMASTLMKAETVIKKLL